MKEHETIKIFKWILPRSIAVTYLLSILYNVSFFMQLVIMPYVIKSLGISDYDNGLVQTVFGVLQMLGSPLYGYLIQKLGLRAALFLCYGSCLTSALALFFSYDLTTLMLSRLPVIFMHGQQAHQTLLSALTEPGQERTSAFGRLGLTFGIGFILTPLLSMTATFFFTEKSPLIFAFLLGFIPFFVLVTFIRREEYERKNQEDEGTHAVMNFSNTLRILAKPGVVNVLLKKNAPIAPALLLFSILQLYQINQFQATVQDGQLSQMVIGVYIMLSNGFGVIWLRTKFDEQKLLFVGTFSFLIGYGFFFFYFSKWLILFIMPFICLGMSLVATVADSVLTVLVEEKEQGFVLGIATSINSLVRTFAPVIAGFFLDTYGFNAFPLIGTISTLFGLFLLFTAPLDSSLLRKAKVDDNVKKME